MIGGGVDIGETIEEALHREAVEEAGTRIKIGKLLFTAMDWFYHRKGKFYQTLQLYYQAEMMDGLKKQIILILNKLKICNYFDQKIILFI